MAYRRKITVDPDLLGETDLADFPVLVEFSDPTLRARAFGGHCVDTSGSDIFFLTQDGNFRLPHEVEYYDARLGVLRCWVRLKEISRTHAPTFYIHYGGVVDQPDANSPESVWDEDFVLTWHKTDDADSSPVLQAPQGLGAVDQITVEAWVDSDADRPEALQALVSEWESSESFDAFSAYDASGTDGLDTTGYFGAVFDGRYVYFSPEQHESDEQHGVVLRYDTQAQFHAGSSYEAYDAGFTAGLETKGFYGGAFDGRYVFFTPRQTGNRYHSRLLRLDTEGEFKDPSSWDAFDIGAEHSQAGAAFDGRYLYLPPGFRGDTRTETDQSGNAIRYDTSAPFRDRSSYASFELTEVLGPDAACFDGGAFDGRYIYFIPLENSLVARYDTTRPYEDPGSWQSFDGKSVGMGMCVGAVFDGRHMYFVAYGNSTLVRYDTTHEFARTDSWERHDAAKTGGLDTSGFDGGFFDGRFVYFVPFANLPVDGQPVLHSNYLRYDPTSPFDDPSSWKSHDASAADGMRSVGYNAGAFDGRYFYAAPWRHSTGRAPGSLGVHGTILRYDTTGANVTFSLRYSDYGHNGGLCAAVPGPSFHINTSENVVGVASHNVLPKGRHHLAGVYDGTRVTLTVDGTVAGQREGSGTVSGSSLGVSIGHITGGLGQFSGRVDRVRISRTARTLAWLEATYLTMSQERYCVVGTEETTD